jgi:hypothetical protein
VKSDKRYPDPNFISPPCTQIPSPTVGVILVIHLRQTCAHLLRGRVRACVFYQRPLIALAACSSRRTALMSHSCVPMCGPHRPLTRLKARTAVPAQTQSYSYSPIPAHLTRLNEKNIFRQRFTFSPRIAIFLHNQFSTLFFSIKVEKKNRLSKLHYRDIRV